MPNPLDTMLARLSTAEGPLSIQDAAALDILLPSGFDDESRHLFQIALQGGLSAVGAAIALAERVLPGVNRTIRKRYRTASGRIDGHAYDAQVSGGDICEGATEAIALCLATIRALRAKGGGE